MQGQIRLRGERIAAQHRNTHLLRNVHAIGGREAFEARCQNIDHHLPSGAVRQQGTVRIQIGLPANRHQENTATSLCENESAVIRAAPAWGHASCIIATWEPMIPGSDWEATSSVCIRFSQVRPLGGKNLLEDDVLVGTVLGFYIGNEVSTPTLCRHKWCPISGRIGETACGISSIAGADGSQRWKRKVVRL